MGRPPKKNKTEAGAKKEEDTDGDKIKKETAELNKAAGAERKIKTEDGEKEMAVAPMDGADEGGITSAPTPSAPQEVTPATESGESKIKTEPIDNKAGYNNTSTTAVNADTCSTTANADDGEADAPGESIDPAELNTMTLYKPPVPSNSIDTANNTARSTYASPRQTSTSMTSPPGARKSSATLRKPPNTPCKTSTSGAKRKQSEAFPQTPEAFHLPSSGQPLSPIQRKVSLAWSAVGSPARMGSPLRVMNSISEIGQQRAPTPVMNHNNNTTPIVHHGTMALQDNHNHSQAQGQFLNLNTGSNSYGAPSPQAHPLHTQYGYPMQNSLQSPVSSGTTSVSCSSLPPSPHGYNANPEPLYSQNLMASNSYDLQQAMQNSYNNIPPMNSQFLGISNGISHGYSAMLEDPNYPPLGSHSSQQQGQFGGYGGYQTWDNMY